VNGINKLREHCHLREWHHNTTNYLQTILQPSNTKTSRLKFYIKIYAADNVVGNDTIFLSLTMLSIAFCLL